MEQPATIVRRAINARQLSGTAALEVERLGATGARVIVEALQEGSLSPERKIRALQLMVLITREQYPHGKLDLIRSASLLVRDESQVVRTTATEMIVVSLQSIARIKQCKPMEPEARRLAQGALEAALECGIREDVRDQATKVLKGIS